MVAQELRASAGRVEAMTHLVYAIDFAWCTNSRNSETARSKDSANSALWRWPRLRIRAASALDSGVKAPLGLNLAILTRLVRRALLSRILTTLGAQENEPRSCRVRSHANFRNSVVSVDVESRLSNFSVRGFVQGHAESRGDLHPLL